MLISLIKRGQFIHCGLMLRGHEKLRSSGKWGQKGVRGVKEQNRKDFKIGTKGAKVKQSW